MDSVGEFWEAHSLLKQAWVSLAYIFFSGSPFSASVAFLKALSWMSYIYWNTFNKNVDLGLNSVFAVLLVGYSGDLKFSWKKKKKGSFKVVLWIKCDTIMFNTMSNIKWAPKNDSCYYLLKAKREVCQWYVFELLHKYKYIKNYWCNYCVRQTVAQNFLPTPLAAILQILIKTKGLFLEL
jgi:hypothetical protein